MSDSPACVLAIDAGGTFLKVALVRRDGSASPDSFFSFPVDSGGSASDIAAAYALLAEQGLRKAREHRLTMSAVCVCIPGPFDYENGISLMTHKYAAIRGIPMRPWLQKGAGNVPVHFIHDSHAFLLGAMRSNHCRGFRRAAGVTLGTGLGFASLFDGKLYKNAQGGPGISIFARPYRRGVSEDYVSRRAVLARYRELCGNCAEDLDVADIARHAGRGEAAAVAVFAETGTCLAGILHDILLENRFECLLLGGGISKSADLFLPQLKEGLSDLPLLRYIATAADIDMCPVLGAAQAASI